MTNKKLILFDVDGILINSRGVGAIRKLIMKHFGLDSCNSKIDMEGKTYRAIMTERLEELGMENPEDHENFEDSMKDASPIQEAFKEGVRFPKIPHVEDLIKKLIEQKQVLGLLTGNTYESAKIKLESIDLWKYFKFGAYGSETRIRSELVDIAMKEAKKETGIVFDKKDIFVIGDTPKDIECARDGKVKSIAIATGKISLEDLKKENPDYLFADFSGSDKILEVINKE